MGWKGWSSGKKSKARRGSVKPKESKDAADPVKPMAPVEIAGVGEAIPPPSKTEGTDAVIAAAASTEPASVVGAADNPAGSEISQPPKTPSLMELRAELARDATFFHTFQAGAKPFSIDKGMSAAIATDESGVEYLAIAKGSPEAKPWGVTEGYSIRVPDEVEAAASGNHVVVTTIARSAGGGQSRFAVAYSTNEVGNSGWRWFAVGPEWSLHEMRFVVPPMIKGNGDFVGVLPEPEEKTGVELACVAVKVAPKAAAG